MSKPRRAPPPMPPRPKMPNRRNRGKLGVAKEDVETRDKGKSVSVMMLPSQKERKKKGDSLKDKVRHCVRKCDKNSCVTRAYSLRLRPATQQRLQNR